MSNVLISSLGQAKLVDFGLAAVDDSANGGLTDADNPRTIDYAALERATGVRKDDTRSDIYFLGCMYYQMLTGVPPLPETTDRTQRLSKTRFLQIVPIQTLDPSIPNNIASAVNKAMALDPDRRYQTPGSMLAELNALYRRLSEGDTGDEIEPEQEQEPTREEVVASLPQSGQQQSIMIVESNTQMQDVFRNGFKRAGYRVLVTSDPQRAVDRFDLAPDTADAIVFNAQNIGQSAVAAFNQLAAAPGTARIPAMLLLGENQLDWRREAKSAEHRVVLNMPITMGKLRDHLIRLIPPKRESG
jgi:serine/threonine protein kinase